MYLAQITEQEAATVTIFDIITANRQEAEALVEGCTDGPGTLFTEAGATKPVCTSGVANSNAIR